MNKKKDKACVLLREFVSGCICTLSVEYSPFFIDKTFIFRSSMSVYLFTELLDFSAFLQKNRSRRRFYLIAVAPYVDILFCYVDFFFVKRKNFVELPIILTSAQKSFGIGVGLDRTVVD